MKLQFICQHFYPEQYPLYKICIDLAKDGNDVSILTGLPNYPEGYIYKDYRFFKNRKEVILGVKVIRCPLVSRGHSKARLFLNYISFAISSMAKSLFIKKDFDAIIAIQTSPITMVMSGIILKAITKKPFYIYTFDLWPESLAAGGVKPNSKIYNIFLKISKYIYGKADKIFVSSRKFEEYFNDVLNISGNIYHLAFYDNNNFLDIKAKEENDIVDLVFAGNIGQMQSVETIIKAANELKDKNVFFHIIGDGSAKSDCEQLAKSFDLKNIKFYGRVDSSKIPEYYSMADAMLITLADNKLISYTLPNKVLSCTASAKPIIACANGEVNETIKKANCGYTCEAENHVKLSKCISEFINSDNKQILGINAREYFKANFTKEIFIKNLYGYIKEQ